MICNIRNENWWFLYFISPPPSLSVMHVWSIAEAHHTNHSLDQKMLKINDLPNHLGNQNCSSTNGDECKNLWASIDFVLMRIWWKQLANKIWNCFCSDIVFCGICFSSLLRISDRELWTDSRSWLRHPVRLSLLFKLTKTQV